MDQEYFEYEKKYRGYDVKLKLTSGETVTGFLDAVIPGEDIDEEHNMIVINAGNDDERQIFINEIKQIKIMK